MKGLQDYIQNGNKKNNRRIWKMNCPNCNSSTFREGPLGKVCQRCGYRNDPRYLERKKQEKDNEK